MKLTFERLRKIINEELKSFPRPSPRKKTTLRLGGVYYNSKRQEVNIQFMDGQSVAYDFLSGGKRTGKETTEVELEKFLSDGGFTLDHVEQW